MELLTLRFAELYSINISFFPVKYLFDCTRSCQGSLVVTCKDFLGCSVWDPVPASIKPTPCTGSLES